MNQLMTKVFVEQPPALPGSANYSLVIVSNYIGTLSKKMQLNHGLLP